MLCSRYTHSHFCIISLSGCPILIMTHYFRWHFPYSCCNSYFNGFLFQLRVSSPYSAFNGCQKAQIRNTCPHNSLDEICRPIAETTPAPTRRPRHYALPLNAERVLSEIWRPDTYIRNGKHSYLHRLTVPNRMLRIRSDGAVLLSQRFILLYVHTLLYCFPSRIAFENEDC